MSDRIPPEPPARLFRSYSQQLWRENYPLANRSEGWQKRLEVYCWVMTMRQELKAKLMEKKARRGERRAARELLDDAFSQRRADSLAAELGLQHLN